MAALGSAITGALSDQAERANARDRSYGPRRRKRHHRGGQIRAVEERLDALGAPYGRQIPSETTSADTVVVVAPAVLVPPLTLRLPDLGRAPRLDGAGGCAPRFIASPGCTNQSCRGRRSRRSRCRGSTIAAISRAGASWPREIAGHSYPVCQTKNGRRGS